MDGKQAAVFCTRKLAVGGILAKMAARLEDRDAKVTGILKSRGPFVAAGFDDWVRSLRD